MRTKLAILPKLLLVLTFLFFLSCHKKNEDSEDVQLNFRNGMDYSVSITLYPKQEYASGTASYRSNDKGSGGYKQNSISMIPNEEEDVFYSGDIGVKPNSLFGKVFDSLVVKKRDTVVMKFTPDTVIGASVNMFIEEPAWEYNYQEYRIATNGSSHLLRSHNYTFVFKELE